MTPTNSTTDPADPKPLLVVLAPPGKNIDSRWLSLVRKAFDWPVLTADHKAGLPAPPDNLGWQEWLERESSHPALQHGVVLITAGLDLPQYFQPRLQQALASPDCPPLFTLPGTHQAGLGSGPSTGTAGVNDSIAAAAARPGFAPVRFRPERLTVIAPGKLQQALEQARQGLCHMYDGIWVEDHQAVVNSHCWPAPDVTAAIGHLNAAFERPAAAKPRTALPHYGFDKRPVTLHISHSWGGGVERWIQDISSSDTRHNHLILASGGSTETQIHGQKLTLYATGQTGRVPVREWVLAPAISSTDVTHGNYRNILAGIIQRFGVGRILVSSLIGHSMDVLGTGLPTAHILHDYYPAWPALDLDPLAFAGEDDNGQIEVARGIAASGDSFLFAERRPEKWTRLAQAWRAAVRTHEIALAAPTNQVLTRWRRLVNDPLEKAKIIPHGFTGWPANTAAIAPRPAGCGRLNLVVVGRLSHGKGLQLLADALQQGLHRHARITLLGCGRQGMEFFGWPGVDIVLDYRHEQLPEHLARIAPQAALFLSTVPETWNYVLSETRALGLVPIATRCGSFEERIEHDETGILFDPQPAGLVKALADLNARPERFDAMRSALPAEASMSGALAALDSLVASRGTKPPAAAAATGKDLDANVLAGRLADLQKQQAVQSATLEELQVQAAEKTRWAQRYERMFNERSRWAQQLDGELSSLRHEFSETVDRLQGELDEQQQALARQRHDLEQQQKKLAQTHAQLENAHNKTSAITSSRSWRLTRPLRITGRLAYNARSKKVWLPHRWPGQLSAFRTSVRTRGWREALLQLQQLPSAPSSPPAAPQIPDGQASFKLDPVSVEPCSRPVASIVVPVYNKVEYTASCLNSVAEHTDMSKAEIIVVDDASSDGTADWLARCSGIRVMTNKENSGFITTCNRGAGAARGEFIVFLNNDTTVTEGWLDALLDTFEQYPQTGVAGARLVYPDGFLQEAGGIIFNDASGWNYGRREHSDLPQYNFVSEADYVSGACLAIRREDFMSLGGFDTRYRPAYYEDTDLCFAMRARGKKVMYQPAATVIHHEGVSSGTDESSGTKKYQAVNRKKFLDKWADVLAQHPAPDPRHDRPDPVRHLRYRRYTRRMLLIDAVTPQPDHDSGSVRIVAIMKLLLEMGYHVTFVPQNLAWNGDYSRALQQMGIEVLHAPPVESIEGWLAENGDSLDLVFASRHYVLAPLLKTIRRACPEATLAFDTVDLHFLREEREAELSGSRRMAEQARRSRKQELMLAQKSDITLVVSEMERVLLGELLPDVPVDVLSNVHQVHGRSRGFEQRAGLLFVGGFQHVPNVDAAIWLIEEIFPRVRKQLPDVELHLIGSRMPPEIADISVPGVRVHGFVPDLDPFLESCRLSVAPLRYGAGVKGKVNQAMSHGLPVIATNCAAEGMFLKHGRDVMIGDSAEDFAAATLQAYTDSELWLRLSNGGLANVEQQFSFEAARTALQRILEIYS